MVTKISEKIEEQVEFCANNELETTIFGKTVKIKTNIKMTQIDHKVRQMQCGGGGMFCTCCDATKAEAQSIPNIEKGWGITRNLADIKALVEKLIGEGRLKTASTSERGGATGLPMFKPGGLLNPHHFVSILHAKLNGLKWCQDMGKHLNAADAFPDQIPIRGLGKKRTQPQKDAIEIADISWKANAKYGLGIPLGQVDSNG